MSRQTVYYDVLTAGKVRAIDSSTDASPIVVTDVAHGLSTGDRVTLFNHATNTNANGTWTVTRVSANTFSLDDSTATGGGAGGATGVWGDACKVIFCEDFRHAKISFATDGGGDANATWKVAGSIEQDAPDFADAQAAGNMYEYTEVIDTNGPDSLDGDTGVAVNAADNYLNLAVNVDNLRWITLVPTSDGASASTWAGEGEFTFKIMLSNDS